MLSIGCDGGIVGGDGGSGGRPAMLSSKALTTSGEPPNFRAKKNPLDRVTCAAIRAAAPLVKAMGCDPRRLLSVPVRKPVQPPVEAQTSMLTPSLLQIGGQKINVSPLYSTSKPSSWSLARKYLSSGASLMYRAQPCSHVAFARASSAARANA